MADAPLIDQLTTAAEADAAQPGSHWTMAFLASWMFLIVLSITDHYDGIMTLMGAPIVSAVLTLLAIGMVAVLGEALRLRAIRQWWCSSYWHASIVGLLGISMIVAALPLGLTEAYKDSIDHTVKHRPHWLVFLPCYLAVLFSIVYWPSRRAAPPTRSQA